MKKNFLLISILCLLFPAAARAEVTFSLGYATGTSPYKNYDRQHVFLPMIAYENEHFYLRGLEAGLKVIQKEGFQASVFAAYDPMEFDPGDSSDFQMRRLDKRRAGILVGGRLGLVNALGHFSASLAGDVSAHSQGLVSRLAYLRPFDFGRIKVSPEGGLYWRSKNYYDYYYGVSRHEARLSGLRPYAARSAWSPFLGLSASLALDEEARWRIFGRSEISFLPAEVKDSPMVDRSTAFGFSTGISFTIR